MTVDAEPITLRVGLSRCVVKQDETVWAATGNGSLIVMKRAGHWLFAGQEGALRAGLAWGLMVKQ